MKIVAFDLSLTRTGFATSSSRTGVLVPPRGYDREMMRLSWIRRELIGLAVGADLVVLEGYGFAPGRGNAARELGELGGVIRLGLYDAGYQFVDVSPASLKKYATGKGNAGKDEVLAAAIRRLGYAGHDSNEADALWLQQMALEAYGLDAVKVPATHREALVKVPWPKLQLAA